MFFRERLAHEQREREQRERYSSLQVANYSSLRKIGNPNLDEFLENLQSGGSFPMQKIMLQAVWSFFRKFFEIWDSNRLLFQRVLLRANFFVVSVQQRK